MDAQLVFASWLAFSVICIGLWGAYADVREKHRNTKLALEHERTRREQAEKEIAAWRQGAAILKDHHDIVMTFRHEHFAPVSLK